MVTGGFLLASLAVLTLADALPAAPPAEPVSPASCVAANAVHVMHNGPGHPDLDPEIGTWKALAFRQKDGPLRVLFELKRLGQDTAGVQRVMETCKAIDAEKAMPILPAAPAFKDDAQTCETAAMALAKRQPPAGADPAAFCTAIDAQIAGYSRIMDGLDAGRLACKAPAPAWIKAGNFALTLEIAAAANGCRENVVTASMSPAPRG